MHSLLSHAYNIKSVSHHEALFITNSTGKEVQQNDNDINEARKEKSKISLLITLSSQIPSKRSSFETLTQTNPCSPMRFGIRRRFHSEQQTSISFPPYFL
ncbi:hypothetical protein CEXT_575371 [Caerostris extrusa]|uniref:Uncharacterized protein n=1 Tax=Caerostris extrusa TaxID=172846 RepID=A0AAV4YEG9_CAEEX|nr:hypothetical protein CEXT_575371 [Caerostris extrusa]